MRAEIPHNILYRNDLYLKLPRDLLDFGASCHTAIFPDYLAKGSRRSAPRKTREIYCRFGMPFPLQEAAGSCNEAEHMSRLYDVIRARFRVRENADCFRPVIRRNTRCNSSFSVDRYCEIYARLFGVLGKRHHRGKSQIMRLHRGKRGADDSAPILQHSVDVLSGRGIGGNKEIGLVLAILAVNYYEHPAFFYFSNCFCHRAIILPHNFEINLIIASAVSAASTPLFSVLRVARSTASSIL